MSRERTWRTLTAGSRASSGSKLMLHARSGRVTKEVCHSGGRGGAKGRGKGAPVSKARADGLDAALLAEIPEAHRSVAPACAVEIRRGERRVKRGLSPRDTQVVTGRWCLLPFQHGAPERQRRPDGSNWRTLTLSVCPRSVAVTCRGGKWDGTALGQRHRITRG